MTSPKTEHDGAHTCAGRPARPEAGVATAGLGTAAGARRCRGTAAATAGGMTGATGAGGLAAGRGPDNDLALYAAAG